MHVCFFGKIHGYVRIIVQVDELRKIVCNDFRCQYTITEITVNVTFRATEGNRVDPREELLKLVVAQCGH